MYNNMPVEYDTSLRTETASLVLATIGTGAFASTVGSRSPDESRIRGPRVTNHPDEQEPQSAARLNDLLLAVSSTRDKAAFQTIFEHFAPRLKSFVLRQGTDEQMAEEIVQETMVKIWRKASQFDPAKASATTWIYTIGRNLRIDMLRKTFRPEPDYLDPIFTPDPEPQGFDNVLRDQETKRIAAAVANLPGEQQEVLKLAFFEDKAHGQVAVELCIPLGTVKSRIRLAFKHMRAELGEIE